MQTEMEQKISSQRSLTSHPDHFSDDAWNLLLKSEEVAKQWRHINVDVEHLLQVIFSDYSYQTLINSLRINPSPLLDQLEEFLAEQEISTRNEFYIGDDLEDLLENADHSRAQWGSKLIEISHILIALARDPRIGSELMGLIGLPSEKLEAKLRRSPSEKIYKNTTNKTANKIEQPNQEMGDKTSIPERSYINENNPKQYSRTVAENNEPIKEDSISIQEEPKALEKYGRDLTIAAKLGELDPVIGRDPEIRKLIKVLSRRGKNNPVLIGSSGVGKTAIAELLAQKIVTEEVPDFLRGLKLIALDLGALIAGTKFRGQFEERFRSVLSEVSSPDSGVILFIDELHTVLSTDRSIADAGSLLKPLLARGEIRCIGATTPEEFQRSIEKDQALSRRFQKILIKEPSIDLSIEILRGVKENYEKHHGVSISDNAVITANRLANRYISDRCLPDKAIDLIDEAAAQLKIEITSKPLILEEAESNLRSIELSIRDDSKYSKEEIIKLKASREIAYKDLLEMQSKWEEEQSLRQELNNLIKEMGNIQEKIIEAETIGNLEQAARLKYEKLNSLQIQKQTIKDIFLNNQINGESLIRDQVESEDIADVVARWTGIPVQRVLAGERQKLLNLENDLNQKVIGQTEALQAVASAIRRARAGMKDPRRPVGSFLFLGPTGVGKTELAKALASSLFDEEEALIRLDMSEFMERNAVARLIGAPPGYVGYEEGGQLTEAVRRRPYAVLLLDEIEKAHPDVFNLLLQVLDDGRLTDSQGRTVDFRNTVIVMTSNLASREILNQTKETLNDKGPEELINREEILSSQIDAALAKNFRPEFLNRIDETIRFNPLNANDLKLIVKLQIDELAKLLKEQGLELHVDQTTIEALANEGYEPEYGARPLKRIIRRKLENPLATELLEDKFQNASGIRVQTANNSSRSLVFFAEI